MEIFEKIIALAVDNGIMAALFVGLLVFVIRDTAKREQKYQAVIDELTKNLKIVQEIHKDVIDIKRDIVYNGSHGQEENN
jgi:preprotein translocase subunit YajC